ncbi:MAG: hypothetical protein RL693_410, partial [Verrucomicrobiota bacterium]
MPKISIHWFRRDLRITDNTALHHAVTSSEQVIPVYILSEWKKSHPWTGPGRQQFLCENLAALAGNIEALGSRLVILQGHADEALEKLIRESRADAVYTNRDPDPFGKAMEARVAAVCSKLGIELHTCKDAVLHEAGEVLTGEGKPYRVYTPYSRNWLAQPKIAPWPKVRSFGKMHQSKRLPLPTLEQWDLSACTVQLPPSGERAARTRMKSFIADKVLVRYGQDRNTPFGRTTSGLSPYLRYGLIGIRELYQRCKQATEGADPTSASSIHTYLKELAWREFYMAILHFYPDVLESEFNADFRNVPWEGSDQFFQAWKQGRTGFPIVDAGMRQLLATGWMHNRVRMIVSMFLTKDLHVHWRLGESFFMQHLVDGEIASNNGGWQWSAGTGADAAPYFRIQNPWTQTTRYDPKGDYIRQWVPELAKVPAAALQSPPTTRLHP